MSLIFALLISLAVALQTSVLAKSMTVFNDNKAGVMSCGGTVYNVPMPDPTGIIVVNFDVQIPVNASVRGVEVMMRRNTENKGGSDIADAGAPTIAVGNQTSPRNMTFVRDWPASLTNDTFGSPSNLWTLPMASFTGNFSANFTLYVVRNNGRRVLIDCVVFTVTYDLPATTTATSASTGVSSSSLSVSTGPSSSVSTGPSSSVSTGPSSSVSTGPSSSVSTGPSSSVSTGPSSSVSTGPSSSVSTGPSSSVSTGPSSSISTGPSSSVSTGPFVSTGLSSPTSASSPTSSSSSTSSQPPPSSSSSSATNDDEYSTTSPASADMKLSESTNFAFIGLVVGASLGGIVCVILFVIMVVLVLRYRAHATSSAVVAAETGDVAMASKPSAPAASEQQQSVYAPIPPSSIESQSTYGSLSLSGTDAGNEHYALMPMNSTDSTYSAIGLNKK